LKEAKSAGDTRYEVHFNLASEAIQKEGCSNQAPKEQVNNNSLNIEENLPSMDNMLLDFGSGDILEIWSNLGSALISHLLHML
jgi:hypothetical protein